MFGNEDNIIIIKNDRADILMFLNNITTRGTCENAEFLTFKLFLKSSSNNKPLNDYIYIYMYIYSIIVQLLNALSLSLYSSPNKLPRAPFSTNGSFIISDSFFFFFVIISNCLFLSFLNFSSS